MKIQWKKVCIKITTWLAAEIILNLLGLDNLADYSEFIFDKEVLIAKRNHKITVVVPPRHPQSNHSFPSHFTIAPQA